LRILRRQATTALCFLSHEIEDRALLAEALWVKSGHKVEVSLPQPAKRKSCRSTRWPMRAKRSAAKLAETQSQQNC